MEIKPILSALMRNKTGPILVALQVAVAEGRRLEGEAPPPVGHAASSP